MSLKENGEFPKQTVKSFLGKMGSRQWVILLLLGLLLMVIALPVSDKKTNTSQNTVLQNGIFAGGDSNETDAERSVLEGKLEDFLSQVEGVGKVRVVLMTGEAEDGKSFYSSGKEKVTGVLIAAQGADNSVVSRNIVEGVMALFQIEAHKIKIVKMK